MRIPFSPPDIREEDIEAVSAVMRSGWITTGPVSREFESTLAPLAGVDRVVTLNSCTAGLEVALRILEIGEGDEVIVPAYTYTASASVVDHVGARIVLVDCAPGEYVPDVQRILDSVTERTKGIIVVDIAGIPFPTVKLREALEGSRAPQDYGPVKNLSRPVVIVDAAHSLGADRDGAPSGSLGDFTAFSFHAVKNLTTGEGGALCWRRGLEADGEELERAIRGMTLHGQTKDALAKTKAGQWEYDILEPGFKFNMPDILAALGLSQLGRYGEMVQRRREIVTQYAVGLDGLADVLLHEGEDFRSSGHLALVGLGTQADRRQTIMDELAGQGIATNVHYKPLPLLTAYTNMGFRAEEFPNAMQQYQAEMTLPLHTLLADDDVAFIIESFRRAMSR